MPRHLISDAHEWTNEILPVPICCLANLQLSERSEVVSLSKQRGKKTLLSSGTVLVCLQS